MNTNFREIVDEFPKEFERRTVRTDWDIVRALQDIGSPADYYLNKELLNHLHQGETATVRGYFTVELGRRNIPIVVWADVMCANFDEEEGRFEYESGWEYLGWDYYFDIKDELGAYLYPRADYLEFMK